MDTVKKFSTFLLFSLLILPGIAGASGQDSINELIKNGGNVNLSGTYTLTGPIMLSSELRLNGQNSTIITIPNSADWSVWVPLMKGEGLHNVTIEGIEFNVNADGNDETPHGRGYYNCIHLIDCKNVTVRNCLFHDGKGDGLRTKYCENVKFYNNVAYKLGHDCFFAIDSAGILAWNNTLTTRTNSGLRLWNSKDAQLFCNRINAQLDSLGGNPGIQIEDSKGTMDDIRVFANTIHETWGPGIWLISYDAGSDNYQNITIDYNRILKDGVSYNIDYTSGITINGVQGTNISNNVFDGCNNAGVLVLDGGQNTKIEKNIITNTQEHPAISQTGTGCGIDNRRDAGIRILNNCFFDNVNGNVFRAESTGDDLQDPTKHNTSSGWVWDGTGWLCDYVMVIENYTIYNSTFENETFENITCGNTTCENTTNNTEKNDTDLHEIIFVPVNNTCPLKNATKNVTACNKSKVKCLSIYDVPLIASITTCTNKIKTTSCTSATQSSTCESGASTCGDSQLRIKIINNSQSETGSKCDSDGETSTRSQIQDANSGGSSGQGEIEVTPVTTPILPVPGFTTDPVSGNGSVPLVVNFHSTAQNAVTIKWNFGDIGDNEATGTDVSHTYSSVGTYTVTQTVTNPNGTLTASAQINVNSVQTPAAADVIMTPVNSSSPVNEVPVTLAANFYANPISGVAPLSVAFTDASTGATTYAWDFGDHVGTSAEQNPSYIFTRAGSYDVVLTVGDGKGHSASKHLPITILQNPPVTPAQLIADFYTDSTNGADPLDVQFTDKSTGAVTWQWDFGDNSPIVTTRNAEHTFGVGNWNVKLKVSDGTNFASKTVTINVIKKQATPIADFTADRTDGESPLTVQFSDKSRNAVSYEWVFGDGETSTEKSPSHIYTVEGDYTVILTVTGTSGEKSAFQTTITVSKTQPKKSLSDLNSNATPLNST